MSTKSFNIISKNKIPSFNKSILVDSDKSISIRSFLLGAISENISLANNVLESEDVFSTIRCLKKLGIIIKKKRLKKLLYTWKRIRFFICKKKFGIRFWKFRNISKIINWYTFYYTNIEIKLRRHSLNKEIWESW